jgi:hypothetical protein
MAKGVLTAAGAWRSLQRELDQFKAIILEKGEHGIRMSGVPKGYVVRVTTTGLRNPRRNDALLKTLKLTRIEKK